MEKEVTSSSELTPVETQSASEASSKLTIKKIEAMEVGLSTDNLTPEECCRRAGVDLVGLYVSLNEIATGADTFVKGKYDDAINLGADNKTRLAAIALILELNKHIKDKSVVTQVGIFNDPKVVAEASRVLGLRDRV